MSLQNDNNGLEKLLQNVKLQTGKLKEASTDEEYLELAKFNPADLIMNQIKDEALQIRLNATENFLIQSEILTLNGMNFVDYFVNQMSMIDVSDGDFEIQSVIWNVFVIQIVIDVTQIQIGIDAYDDYPVLALFLLFFGFLCVFFACKIHKGYFFPNHLSFGVYQQILLHKSLEQP